MLVEGIIAVCDMVFRKLFIGLLKGETAVLKVKKNVSH